MWKNSSWVRSLPAMNWMSSMSSTSMLAVARAELVDTCLAGCGDELVGELLAGDVDDALARARVAHRVADGVHEVRLAEADAAVEEERVVGVAGSLGDGEAGRVGELVGRADDEGAEGVARVQVDGAALRAADASGLEADPGVARPRPPPPGCSWLVRPARTACLAHLELHVDGVADDPRQRLADERAVAALEPVLGEAAGHGDAEERSSSTATRAVSLSQVSKFAGDSETCSSPRAARQTCLASIDSNVTPCSSPSAAAHGRGSPRTGVGTRSTSQGAPGPPEGPADGLRPGVLGPDGRPGRHTLAPPSGPCNATRHTPWGIARGP